MSPLPDPDAYQRALLKARAARLALDRNAVLRIRLTLRRYVDELEVLLRDRFPDARIRAGILEAELLEESIRLNDLAARRLLRALLEAIENGRNVTFQQILEIWQEAGRQAAASIGGLGLIGGLRVAPVSLLGAYESAGGAANWRTLLRGHVANAAAEADAIVRGALTEGVGIDELARRMRRYVVGSERFDALFDEVPTLSGKVAKIDLRRLRGEQRDAARQMEYNARRIAITEDGNARREAEVQHMTNDPLIGAIRWRLSPSRGELVAPDACDLLATVDWYGLGAGVFPVAKVPTEPHPQGHCELESVPRALSQAVDPKPNPERVVQTQHAQIPREADLTPAKIRQIRQQTERAIRFGEAAAQEIERAS